MNGIGGGRSSSGSQDSENFRANVDGCSYSSRSIASYRSTYEENLSAARIEAYEGSSHHVYESDRWTSRSIRGHPNADDHRHWVYNASLPPLPASIDRFIIVSYNILGVDNANKHLQELYWHIPPFIMKWSNRKRKILSELGLWSPDIICLQEVDRFEELQNDLIQEGYGGVYKGRTGGSADGCAMFWRTKKFALLQEESIEFQELDLKHNVAQLCVLKIGNEEENRSGGKQQKEIRLENVVVVCNIHVLFNPNRGEIKLGQVRHLLEKAHSLSIEWEGAPIILAGDFNSVPQSPLYQFLKNGMLDLRNCNRRSISGQAEGSVKVQETVHRGQIYSDSFLIPQTHRITEETYIFQWTLEELIKATAVPNESLMRHSLNLRSAYPSIQGSEETRGTSNEPIITTYHRNFMGTVDYIWYTNGLSAVRVLEVLPISILQRTHGLPSKKWGSDHMTIACEFAFI